MFKERETEIERLEVAKAQKLRQLEEKHIRLVEQHERDRIARKERERKMMNDAIDMKKREIQEKI